MAIRKGKVLSLGARFGFLAAPDKKRQGNTPISTNDRKAASRGDERSYGQVLNLPGRVTTREATSVCAAGLFQAGHEVTADGRCSNAQP